MAPAGLLSTRQYWSTQLLLILKEMFYSFFNLLCINFNASMELHDIMFNLPKNIGDMSHIKRREENSGI